MKETLCLYIIPILFYWLSVSESQNQPTQKVPVSECCTCDEALYEMKFQGIWSRQTHPKDYPESDWLIHWSDIVGASHTKDLKMWEYGNLASAAVKRVAEYGDTSKLERELKKKAKHIRTIIKIKGLYHPNVQGSAKANIRLDKYRHLVSFLSMLGPSPDWLAGLNSINLCTKNCSWVREMEIDLRPIDAGTDSGLSYMSPNQPTIPQIPMRPLSKIDPNSTVSPWYDPDIASRYTTGLIKPTEVTQNRTGGIAIPLLIKPVAKVTFVLLKVFEGVCDAQFYQKFANLADVSTDTGLDNVDIEEPDTNSDEFMRKKLMMMGSGGAQDLNDPCATTIWSEWSPCSVTCGKGVTMRRRYLIMPHKEGMCQSSVPLVEKGMCMSDIPDCNDVPSPKCALKHWSAWSPCSSTCGKGMRFRTREYENEQGANMMGCSYNLMEKELCMDRPECDVSHDNRCHTTIWSSWSDCSSRCGDGTRYRSRHYVTPKVAKKHCAEDLIEKESCGSAENGGVSGGGDTCQAHPPAPSPNAINNGTVGMACHLSLWSEWSPCTATCGTGSRVRTRYFIRPSFFYSKVPGDTGIKDPERANNDRCTESDVLANTDLVDVEPCVGVQPECIKNTTMSNVHCRQSPKKGPCRGQFFRWYYNPRLQQCRRFWYGGCQGNDNNFYNYLDCKQMCELPLSLSLEERDYVFNEDTNPNQITNDSHSSVSNNSCVFSEWSEWTPCSKTCGRGFSKRFRMLKSKENGANCENDLFQDKYCNDGSCTNECKYGIWSGWSVCDECQPGTIQMRTRYLLNLTGPNHDPADQKIKMILGCENMVEKRECRFSYYCTKNYASAK